MMLPVCFTTLVLSYVSIAVMVTIVRTLATPSSLEMKAKMLIDTGWRSSSDYDTSEPYTWPGVSCNKAGVAKWPSM